MKPKTKEEMRKHLRSNINAKGFATQDKVGGQIIVDDKTGRSVLTTKKEGGEYSSRGDSRQLDSRQNNITIQSQINRESQSLDPIQEEEVMTPNY